MLLTVTDLEKELTQQRILAWKRASVAMDAVRDEDTRSANTHDAMRVFSGSANWAATHRPASPTSGLVEQQRWFSILHYQSKRIENK